MSTLSINFKYHDQNDSHVAPSTLVRMFQVNSTLKMEAVIYSARLQVMSQVQLCILEACRFYLTQNISND